jgi:hypothetical protein
MLQADKSHLAIIVSSPLMKESSVGRTDVIGAGDQEHQSIGGHGDAVGVIEIGRTHVESDSGEGFVASKDIKAAERSAFEDAAIWQRFILVRQMLPKR